MKEKKIRVKTWFWIQTVLGWIGVGVSLVGFMMGGTPKQILPWVGLGLVGLSAIVRAVLVRCPYCGNHLLGNSVPEKCPECHKEIN